MRYAKIERCKARDIIMATTNLPSNIYFMTEANFNRYNNGGQDFIRIAASNVTTTTFYAPFDGDWYLVFVPQASLLAHQASFTHEKFDGLKWNNVNGESVIVHNAPNTAGKDNFDKADYWEEQKDDEIMEGFICPSCHESVKRDEIDGEHVKLSHVTNSKTYIVPTCQHCNRGRQDKDFIVPASWLVELPEKK